MGGVAMTSIALDAIAWYYTWVPRLGCRNLKVGASTSSSRSSRSGSTSSSFPRAFFGLNLDAITKVTAVAACSFGTINAM